MTATRSKNVYFFQVFQKKPRLEPRNYPPINWVEALPTVGAKPRKERMIGDLVYETELVDNVPIVGIHKPLDPAYMQYLSDEAERTMSVFEVLKDSGQSPADEVGKYVNSTVVAFMNDGLVAVCMSGQSCPRIGSLLPFLEEFFPPREDDYVWGYDAFLEDGDIKRFQDRSTGVRKAELSFTTARNVFTPDDAPAASILTHFDAMADQIGGDLEVKVTIDIARGSRNQSTTRSLRDAVANDMPRHAMNTSGKAQVVSSEGMDEEDLDLLQHKLTHQVQLVESEDEAKTFKNLVKAVAGHCRERWDDIDL